MSRRVMSVFWDVTSRIHRNSEGAKISSSQHPYIIFKEKPLIHLRLVTDDDNTAFTEISSSDTFSVVIDDDFDHASVPFVKTQDPDINVSGEFVSGTNADPTQGQFSIRLNGNTTEFDTAIASLEEKADTKLELQAIDTNGDLTFATQMPFRVLNVMDTDATDDPVELSTNLFLQEIIDPVSGKKCVRVKDSDGVIITTHCPPGTSCT